MLDYYSSQMRSAFSLVELSIVLVILGLLVGGVLSGQSLIHAAELRSVATEYSRYIAATRTFRDKYFALPGDMPNATSFWGAEPLANCDGSSATPSTGTATCNGNGNGQVSDSGYVSEEQFRYWQHLANAGLINGTYSGNFTTATQGVVTVGVNIPASKYNANAGWDIRAWDDQPAGGTPPSAGYFFEGSYSNAFRLGSQPPASGGQSTGAFGAVFIPADAWNIDSKMDDGKPGTGSVRTLEFNDVPCNNVALSNAVAIATTASYNLANTAASCTLVFPDLF